MTEMSIQDAKFAYKYPLLIKQLWHTPLVQAPDQVIVYRDMKRFTYRQLRERIGRLASSLARLGVGAGDTVGVLDWDSNRFLEAYFAVPMMGAVLDALDPETREVGLLRWLHRQRGRAVTRSEILEQVFGQRGDLQTRAVDMAIAVLRKKVEPNPEKPTVIISVKGAGYAWRLAR